MNSDSTNSLEDAGPDPMGPDLVSSQSTQIIDRTVIGFGLLSFGHEADRDHTVLITRWITLLFIPVVPVSRWRCRYLGEAMDDSAWSQAVMTTFQFHGLNRVPISIGNILQTVFWTFVALCLTLIPLTFFILNTANRKPNTIEAIAIISILVITGSFPFLVAYIQKKKLEATWSREFLASTAGHKNRQKDWNKSHWAANHVFPEWLLTVVFLLGSLPGFVLGKMLGWPNGMSQIMACVTALLSLGAGTLVDRWLTKRRTAAEELRRPKWDRE